MRVAIATSGRFHVLDLARELAALGHDVKLYSILPDSRAEMFGFARHNHRSLLPYVAPLIAWQRYVPRLWPQTHNWAFRRALDRVVTARLEPCDVFICMSGIFVTAIEAAKQRYGARVYVERGSRHILSQAEILAAIPGAVAPNEDVIARELEGYRLADRIAVPSRHVADSFERDPAAHAKLFRNPYGTKLDMFPYSDNVSDISTLSLIFAGGWSLRKGCDVLEAAIRDTADVCLHHVGRIADLPFPSADAKFRHSDPVAQPDLAKHYRASRGFVHASREEGLSMVQAQALASGLPLICTDRTGGVDLGHTPALQDRITVVGHGSSTEIRDAIERLRGRLQNGPNFSPLQQVDLETLSWGAYAKRYSEELMAEMATS